MGAIGIKLLIIFYCQIISNKANDKDYYEISSEEFKHDVIMISDIQTYYRFKSVFMILGSDEGLLKTTMIKNLIRKFSEKMVSCLTMNHTDVLKYRNLYSTKMVRPLFVALLSSTEEVTMFEKMSQKYEMSNAFWLIVFSEPMRILCPRPRSNYFHVTFDTEMMVKCYGDPVIREWYSLNEKDLIVKELGSWDPINRFQLKTLKSLYERRNNLAGKNLRIVTVKDSSYVSGPNGQMDGFFAKILQELQSALNFTITRSYEENYYGFYNEITGEWNGAVGRLIRREVDMGVSDFTMTESRRNVMDFTQPVLLSRHHLYIKSPDGSVLKYSAYFGVFDVKVWVSIQAMLILATLTITYIKYRRDEITITIDHVSENFLSLFGIYCQQGLPDFPTASSSRIVYFSMLTKAVLIYATYSASLISYIAVVNPSLPFTHIEHFAEDTSYKLLTLRESSDYDLFITSTDEVMKSMKSKIPDPKYLPRTTKIGFEMVCNQTKTALHSTYFMKSTVSHQVPCDVMKLQSGRIDSIGMTLTKRSQFTGIINFHLHKFRDVGILNRLKKKFFDTVSSPDTKFNPVSFSSILTNLYIIGGGAVFSIIIFVIEFIQRAKDIERNGFNENLLQ